MPPVASGSKHAAKPRLQTHRPKRHIAFHSSAADPRGRLMKTFSSLPVLMMLTSLALVACSAPSGAATPTRTARTPTPSPIPIATAVIYVDSNRQPVWPTPPASCSTSAVASERPDLGPTLGEFPLWLARRSLPVIPWRNELVRTVWVVDRAASGDLALSGHQVDGPGTVRFI